MNPKIDANIKYLNSFFKKNLSTSFICRYHLGGGGKKLNTFLIKFLKKYVHYSPYT